MGLYIKFQSSVHWKRPENKINYLDVMMIFRLSINRVYYQAKFSKCNKTRGRSSSTFKNIKFIEGNRRYAFGSAPIQSIEEEIAYIKLGWSKLRNLLDDLLYHINSLEH